MQKALATIKTRFGAFPYKESMSSSGLFGIGLGVTFVGQLVLSNAIAPHDFGVFIIIYSAAAVFSAIGSSGFDLSAIRFISIANSEQNYGVVRQFVHFVFRTTVFMSISGAIFFVLFMKISESIDFFSLFLSALVVFFWSCTRSLSGVLRGLEALSLSIVIDRVARDLAIFLFAIFSYAFAINASIFAVLLSLLGGAFFGVLAGLVATWAKIRKLPLSRAQLDRDYELERGWGHASLGLMRYNLIELLSSRLDVFILSFLISTDQVGAFGIALILLNIVGIPAVFLGILLMPKLAILGENSAHTELNRMFKTTSLLAVGFGIAIALALYLGQSVLIQFMSASMASMLDWDVVFAALFFRALSLIGTFPVALLAMTGRHNALLFANFSSMLIRIVAYYLFFQHVSAELGVFAFVGGAMLMTTIALFQVRKQILGANPKIQNSEN